MRIALLSYEYPPDTGFGGIGTYSYYHARALVKLGHSVHVFAGATKPGAFHSEHDGVRVTRLKTDGWFGRVAQSARSLQCFWFHNRIEAAHASYVALREALKCERFDVIEAPECGADAAAISVLSDLPLVIRFHSPAKLIMGTYKTTTLDRRLTAAVEQVAIKRARVRTSCSGFVAREAVTRMSVAPPVHVIPNGIDVDAFDQDEGVDVGRRFGIPRTAVVTLFANRLEERKGVHILGETAVRVLTERPDAHFVIAGRDLFGYLEARVWPMIKSAGVERRFHVTGAIPHGDVRALCRRADLFLLPSLWENCPYSCIEAMTARCAVVSSDCGGMPELIGNRQNGLLARTGDATAFAAAIRELLDDAALRERLGAAARATVEERLRDTQVAAQAVGVYRETTRHTA